MRKRPEFRAIMVCVEYGDILRLTLPYNRHHFKEVMVVTTSRDTETIQVAKQNDAALFFTESFYTDGALFNKWKALEEGLDGFGRDGLMCLMDADVLWPKEIKHHQDDYQHGKLYSPYRRIQPDLSQPIPPEVMWKWYVPFTDYQWAGYTQIFYGLDSHLPHPPWHQTNWTHAGGADSFFQDLWPKENKVRPNWQVLHLGTAMRNWAGRVTPRTDGTLPVNAEQRRDALGRLMAKRRDANPAAPYAAEMLPKQP